MTCRLITSYLT